MSTSPLVPGERDPGETSDAAPALAADAGQIDHDPTGQPPCQLPQPLVGGAGHVGEQGEGPVGFVIEERVEGPLIEHTHLGRHVLEAFVAAEILA